MFQPRALERSGDLCFVIISDNHGGTCLIITINDTCTCDLPLIITISDTSKNQPKRLVDSDNQINLSILIVTLRGYPLIRSVDDKLKGLHKQQYQLLDVW